MSQETIARILAIEEGAGRVHDDAQRQATRMVEKAQKSAAALREQSLSQARQQARQIVVTGQEQADAERARIVAQAEAEAQGMEATAAHHLEHAANFVLKQVAGAA